MSEQATVTNKRNRLTADEIKRRADEQIAKLQAKEAAKANKPSDSEIAPEQFKMTVTYNGHTMSVVSSDLDGITKTLQTKLAADDMKAYHHNPLEAMYFMFLVGTCGYKLPSGSVHPKFKDLSPEKINSKVTVKKLSPEQQAKLQLADAVSQAMNKSGLTLEQLLATLTK